jgi:hypothetical protein
MATSMMIQSAASIGSASLQICSKGHVEAHSHTSYCVGILALIHSYSYFLWFMNFNESSYVVTPGLFTSSQNLFFKLLHPCLETSLIHNLRVSTHWGTWFHLFPASCSYALRSFAVTVESNHAVSVLYDQMPWHLISRMSHACFTGRM